MSRKQRGLASWTVEQRFWRNVSQIHDDSSCWIWTGARAKSGYGLIRKDGKRVYAHRLSYEINVGRIVAGQVVCHRCDVRDCVRPSHLFAGSVADNNRDMWSKGRGRGLNPRHGKLSEAQRRQAVARVNAGESKTEIAVSLGVTRQAIAHLIRAGIYG